MTILSGHSGGPVLNRRGEVIGWAVMSDRSIGPQLRPVERLLEALTRVLNAVAPGRAGDVTTVRDRLLGYIPESERLDLGDGITWEAATRHLRKASEAAAQAQASAEQADDAALDAEQSAQDAVGAASDASASASAAGALGYAGALQGLAHIGQTAQQQLQLLEAVPYLNTAAPLSGAPLQFASMRTALQPITLQLPGATSRDQALAPVMKPKRVVIQTSGDIAAISMPAQREEFESALASELELKLPPDSIELQPDERSVQIARREASIVLSGLTKIERRGVEAFVAEHLAFSAANLRVIPISGSLYLHIAGPAWAMLLLTQLFVAGDDGIRQLLLARGLGEPLNIQVAPAQPAVAAAAAAEPAAQTQSSDPGGEGTFLVTSCSRLVKAGKEFSLDASLREIQAFRRFATVHENASLAEFPQDI